MNIFTISRVVCLLFLSSFQLLYAQSYKQKQNNIWLGSDCMGCGYYKGLGGAGLDFNGDSVKTIRGVESPWLYGAFSNGSAISDKNGNLLFYTDGNIVYDRNHKIMPNGRDINNSGQLPANLKFVLPDGASSENFDGVVIMPKPGSSHEYYIFSAPLVWEESGPWSPGNNYQQMQAPIWWGKLYCSTVDMEMNNGFGAVKDNGRLIADSMAGNLHGIVGDNCNDWLIGYGSSGVYKSFQITSLGIDTIPVISAVGIRPGTLSIATLWAQFKWPYTFVGELTASPNRHKVAMAMDKNAQLADFDPSTGKLTNVVYLAGLNTISLAFSANDSLLYLSGVTGLRQYQTYSPSSPVNLLSLNDSLPSYIYEYDGPLRLAPNGKIYFTHGVILNNLFYKNYPMCIQNPNLLGAACNIDTIGPPGDFAGAVPQDHPLPFLVRGNQFSLLMPNEVPVLLYDTVYASKIAYLCFNQPTLLEPQPMPGTDYHWMINTIDYAPGLFKRMGGDTTATILATVPGTYTVQYFTSNPCVMHRDTFYVDNSKFSLYLGNDTVSCNGAAINLKVDIPGAEVVWQDGSTDNRYMAEQSGSYWVQILKDGCTARDSINLLILNLHQDLGKDTVLCFEDPMGITLLANTLNGSSILWNTGSSNPSIQTSDSGLYWVSVNYETCLGTDSIYIEKQYCECPYMMPTAFSPNKDGKNDIYRPAIVNSCPIKDYVLEIYNRWGQLVFVSYDWAKGWDGVVKNMPADIGTYYYHLEMTTGLRNNRVGKKGDLELVR